MANPHGGALAGKAEKIDVGLRNVYSDTQVSFHEVEKWRREKLPRMQCAHPE